MLPATEDGVTRRRWHSLASSRAVRHIPGAFVDLPGLAVAAGNGRAWQFAEPAAIGRWKARQPREAAFEGDSCHGPVGIRLQQPGSGGIEPPVADPLPRRAAKPLQESQLQRSGLETAGGFEVCQPDRREEVGEDMLAGTIDRACARG